MIVPRAPDQVTRWSLAFFERGRFRHERFVPGRFKHVVAFGYSDPAKSWVVLDVTFGRTEVFVLPDGAWGMAALARWIDGAAVLTLPACLQVHKRTSFLRPFTCVSAAAHLVGVGAVLPDGLWRSCLRNGATIVSDGKQQPAGPLCPAGGTGP